MATAAVGASPSWAGGAGGAQKGAAQSAGRQDQRGCQERLLEMQPRPMHPRPTC